MAFFSRLIGLFCRCLFTLPACFQLLFYHGSLLWMSFHIQRSLFHISQLSFIISWLPLPFIALDRFHRSLFTVHRSFSMVHRSLFTFHRSFSKFHRSLLRVNFHFTCMFSAPLVPCLCVLMYVCERVSVRTCVCVCVCVRA